MLEINPLDDATNLLGVISAPTGIRLSSYGSSSGRHNPSSTAKPHDAPDSRNTDLHNPLKSARDPFG
jgi:hypothetical protein